MMASRDGGVVQEVILKMCIQRCMENVMHHVSKKLYFGVEVNMCTIVQFRYLSLLCLSGRLRFGMY